MENYIFYQYQGRLLSTQIATLKSAKKESVQQLLMQAEAAGEIALLYSQQLQPLQQNSVRNRREQAGLITHFVIQSIT